MIKYHVVTPLHVLNEKIKYQNETQKKKKKNVELLYFCLVTLRFVTFYSLYPV